MKHWFLSLLAAVLLNAGALGAEDSPAPASVPELLAEIEAILQRTRTPGLALALVDRNGIIYTGGLGLADVADNMPATAATLFRLGSTSKGFVSLAALKLQAEGRLDLNATLASAAPEIEFENPWEAANPVRLVHLLEHTAGFEDIHLREFANQDPRPDNLREALAFDPDSRISRWPPGTRMAYSNSGPAIVAYVIRQIVGMPFEDYVQREFFDAIGMTGATYFPPPAGVPMTELYAEDGRTPYPYWHISIRPSGALNASANDMASYLSFYLNRGRVGERQVVRAEDLARMEMPATWEGARAGLRTGYGLSNYSSIDAAGWIWHGHNGGVQGGASDLSYNLDNGVGYAVMVNATNGDSLPRIVRLIRAFLLREAGTPPRPPAVPLADELAGEFAGFYVSASPRNELIRPVERIAGVLHLGFDGDGVRLGGIFGPPPQRYVGETARTLRRENASAADVALLETRPGADVMITAGTATFRKTNPLVAFTPLVILLLAQLAALVSVIFALVWGVRWKLGWLDIAPTRALRLYPLLSSLSVFAFFLATGTALGDDQVFSHYGSLTVRSLLLAVLGIVATAAVMYSAWQVLRRSRQGAHRGVLGLALVTVCSQAALMLCLAWLGMIPMITWL